MELNMKSTEHVAGQSQTLVMTYNVLLEELIMEVGGCGLFQMLLNCIVHFVQLSTAFSMLTMAFAGSHSGFECLDSAGDVISNSSMKHVCDLNATVHCHEILFDSSMKTVVSEWSLVCDRAWMVAMITTVQNIGLLIGALIAGHAADHFGRKPLFFSGVLIMVIFNVAGYFSTDWVMFAVIRCFIGIGGALYFVVRDSILIEVTSTKWRPVAMAFPSWTIGCSLFGLFAWIFKDWKNMQLAFGCFGIPVLLTWWFVPEGFRWMVTKERFQEAERTMHKIATLNRKPMPELDYIFKVAKEENEKKNTERKYSVIDMLRTKESVKHTLILMVTWFSCSVAYYGFTFGVKSLSGNIYMNIFLMNIVEVPCIFSVAYFINWFGRKKCSLALLLLSGSTGIAVGVMQHIDYPLDGGVMNALSITSKVSCTCVWQAVIIWTAEYYPTVIRAVATGTLGFAATVGAIIAPQIVYLNDATPGLLYLTGGALMMVSLSLVILLKETKGLPLNDTLADGNSHNRRQEKLGYPL